MTNRCEPGGSSCFGVEADGARRADVGEVGPLRVHVVVDAEDHDVVLRQELELRLVDRVRGDDRLVVAIVPERVLVRDDHVQARRGRLADHVERHERGRRDAGDLGVRPAELEGVAIGGVAPRRAEILLDAIDDLAGLHGHARSPVRIADGDVPDGHAGDHRLQPVGADLHAGIFREHAADENQRLLVAGRDLVARVFDRLPLADFAGDDGVDVRQHRQRRLDRRRSGQQADPSHAVSSRSPTTRMPPRDAAGSWQRADQRLDRQCGHCRSAAGSPAT